MGSCLLSIPDMYQIWVYNNKIEEKMNRIIATGIAISVFCALGFTSAAAQTINSATMTLIDNDGNGYANIGDEVQISVIVDGAESGTSVRIFDNDLFAGAGPFNLNKITTGFGNNIEYAITLPIDSGTTHDGAASASVEFIIQVRLGGVTMDDLTSVTISGITESIDNVRPVLSNVVFDDLGAGTLVTGDDFEISIETNDGSGIASVTADLRRLGLGESVAVPFDAGDSYLLDSEQILEAQHQEQVSLNQNRSVVFTVTDEAGNASTRDSDDDGQNQDVDNVSPSAPVVVAVQRATNFDSSQDLFDIVITNGDNPRDENNDPLLDESGQQIMFSDLLAGGQYHVYWNGGDGVADDLLTSTGYQSNGVMVALNIPFSEYAEGESLLFRVVPVKDSGLEGADADDDINTQRGIVEAEILSPEDGFLVGNIPSDRFEITAQMVDGLDGYELINSRVYLRDVPNPGIHEFIDMLAMQDGTLQPNFIVSASDFSGAGFSDELEAVVRPQFRINGVQLRTLTPAIIFQNNPVRTYNVDYQNPVITLESVDGNLGVAGFFDVEASGETEFVYTITDNFEMDPDVATITARFVDDGTGSEVLVLGPNTMTSHINNGLLSVDNDDFTFIYDVSNLPVRNGDPEFEIRVNDGRGNQTPFTGAAVFTVLDDVEPDFVWTNPVPGTQFRNTISYNLSATNPDSPSAQFTGYTIQFAESADFDTPYDIRASTISGSNSISGTINMDNLQVSIPALADGHTYFIRAVIDKNPQQTTAAIPVVYNETGPMVALEFPDAMEVNGQMRVRGDVPVTIHSDDYFEVVNVSARNANNTFSSNGVTDVTHTGFMLNTNHGSLAQNAERDLFVRVTTEDQVGNQSVQYFTIFGDNRAPDITYVSINGQGTLNSLPPVTAGSAIEIAFEIIQADFIGDVTFTLQYTVDGENVSVPGDVDLDEAGQTGTVVFQTVTATNNVTVDLTPGGDVLVDVSDLLGNTGDHYVGTAIGGLQIIGSEIPSALFRHLANGMSLTGDVSGDIAFSTIGNPDAVRLELRKAGATGGWDNLGQVAPGNAVGFNTTNYTDGEYDLRLVTRVGNETKGVMDPVRILIDNTNNGTSERANIIDLAGERHGGQQIQFRAEAGADVGGVEFRIRRTDGGAAFTVLGGTKIKDGSNTFMLTLSPQDMIDAGYVADITDLDGEHELKAVAFDLAGHAFEKAKGNTPDYDSGNADNANETARTFVNFDFRAPVGSATFNGIAVPTGAQWSGQSETNFYLLADLVDVVAELEDHDDDFEQVRITLERNLARTPGSASATFPGRSETTIAVLMDDDNLAYDLDVSALTQGGLYRLRIYFSDDLGNESLAGDMQFVAGKPQVRIAGFNPVKQELYLTGPIHTQSARLSYASGDDTFTTLGTFDLNTYGANDRDHARRATVQISELDLSDGEITFRVLGADRSAANFSEARFADTPSTLTFNSEALALQAVMDQSSRPVSFLSSAWQPNLSNSEISLRLNRDAGDLSNIRFEVEPPDANQEISLMLMLDTNPYSSESGNVLTGMYSRNVENDGASTDFFTGRLEVLDGDRLGFVADNQNVNLLTGGTNISTGGVLYAFATMVNADGSVDMNMDQIKVHRVAANQGGEILSRSEQMTLSIEENVLDKNAGIYVEEDRARFNSTNAQQLHMGQLGPAYWVSSPNGAELRSGMRAGFSVQYDPDELGDIDPARITIATITANDEFDFSTGVRNKVVDTTNHVVRFNMSSLSTAAQRYTLVVDGLQSTDAGSIELADFRAGAAGGVNYTQSTGMITAIVTDNMSGIDPGTVLMYVNNNRITMPPANITDLSGSSSTYRFRANLAGLELAEGIHNARFVVENNSGDRLNTEIVFMVDNTAPQIRSEMAVVGKESMVSFSVQDMAVADTSGAGLDTSTVYIDVWGIYLDRENSVDSKRLQMRLEPSQLTYSGDPDAMTISYQLPSGLASGQFDNLMFVVHNQPGLQIQDELGVTQYIAGSADRAGNTMSPFSFTAVYDNDPPEIELISKSVETGLRFRVTDEKSGVDPESIAIELIDAETGMSMIYSLDDSDDLTFNESNGNLIFNTQAIGSEVVLSVSDQVGNTAVEDMVAESQFLSITDLYNYPNPFNPTTDGANITFVLSRSATVEIELFDFIGRRASRVVQNETYPAGRSTVPIAGRALDGRVLSNGVYFMRVVARDGDRTEEAVFKTVIAK